MAFEKSAFLAFPFAQKNLTLEALLTLVFILEVLALLTWALLTLALLTLALVTLVCLAVALAVTLTSESEQGIVHSVSLYIRYQ